MAFNAGKLTANLSLKKKIDIRLFKMFLFCVYRMKIGEKHGKHMILLACPWAYKAWWV